MKPRFLCLLAILIMGVGHPAHAARSSSIAQAFIQPAQINSDCKTELELIVVASTDQLIQKVKIAIPDGWTILAPVDSTVLKGSAAVEGSAIVVRYGQGWKRGEFDSIMIKAKSPLSAGAYAWNVKINDNEAVPDVPKVKSLTVRVVKNK